jgi:hypothetical protein
MGDKYTPEEQELINELSKFNRDEETADSNKLADLLMNKVGDLSFNAKLRADKSGSVSPEIKDFLEYFTYKTRDIDQFSAIDSKLEIALESRDKQLPIEEYEKLTLSEYNKISEPASLYKKTGRALGYISEKCNNPEFKEMYSKLQRSDALIKRLDENAVDVTNYKAGDLMMYLTEKTVAIKGRQKMLGHEGRLEEVFVTKYNHAAPIYINNNNPDRPTANRSEIGRSQQSDEVSLGEILQADTFRIDPTKLVNKKQIKLLEKVDYGYRENNSGEKVKITWQEVMRERYEQLSNALHEGQIPHKLEQVYKEKSKHTKKLEDIYIRFKTLEKQDRTPEIDQRMLKLIKLAEGETKQIEHLEGLEKEYKSNLLTNDQKRLKPGHWVNPKTILGGHKKWFEKNDFRDLSQKMYNATPDQKEMICSEFAARSIVSTIDRLNELTSMDLQAAKLTQKETTVVKSPISERENFTNLHPERLSKILEESGCVEKVENGFLKDVMQLDNVKKSKLSDKEQDYTTKLPKKIYSLLQSSKTKEEFMSNANGAVDIYLTTAKVEKDIIELSKVLIVNNRLEEIYEKHHKEPKGALEKINHVCIKTLEFCHFRTKDANAKKDLDTMIKDIKNSIVPEKQVKPRELSQEINTSLQNQAGIISADLRPHISQVSNSSTKNPSASPGRHKTSSQGREK